MTLGSCTDQIILNIVLNLAWCDCQGVLLLTSQNLQKHMCSQSIVVVHFVSLNHYQTVKIFSKGKQVKHKKKKI